jgi:hypothetical protein
MAWPLIEGHPEALARTTIPAAPEADGDLVGFPADGFAAGGWSAWPSNGMIGFAPKSDRFVQSLLRQDRLYCLGGGFLKHLQAQGAIARVTDVSASGRRCGRRAGIIVTPSSIIFGSS